MEFALINTVNTVFTVLFFMVLARVLMSWLPMAGIRIDPYNPIVQLLFAVTDPILEPLRRFTTVGMIDLSPIVALFGLQIVQEILVGIIRSIF